MQVRRPWLVGVLTAVFLAITASAQSSGSGFTSGDTEENEVCVLPPEAPSVKSQNENIADAVLKARCLAICLQEQQLENGEFIVHTNDGYSYLRESDLESDCNIYNQVYECARGCVIGNSSQETAECSQECISLCASTADYNPENYGGCEKSCSLQDCDNGCYYATSFAQTSNLGSDRPSKPSAPLELMADASTAIGVYTVSAPDEDNWLMQPASRDDRFVTFLIQVEEVEQAETFYIVKAGLPERLSLSFLSCEDVFMSHCLVNENGRSQFSPQSSVLSVEGVIVTQPSTVSNVQLSYFYDMRPGFFGHYCVNLNWTNPTDLFSVWVFRVDIVGFGSPREVCGTPITSFIQPTPGSPTETTYICATTEQSAPISKCSYVVLISTVPTVRTFQTVSTTLLSNVPVYEPDDPELECIRWLNTDNLFAINLTVHLSEYLSNERVVSGFVFLLTKQTVLEGGSIDEDIIRSPYMEPFSEAGSMFREIFYGLQPYTADNVEYTIILSPQWNSYVYDPEIESFYCSVSAQTMQPDPVQQITVNKLVVLSTSYSFILSVTWDQPVSFNGEFVKYEIVVGPTSLQLSSTDIPGQFTVLDILNIDQRELEEEIIFHPTFSCYYLQIRSVNSYLPSNWSEPVVLALDERCEYYVEPVTPSVHSTVPMETEIALPSLKPSPPLSSSFIQHLSSSMFISQSSSSSISPPLPSSSSSLTSPNASSESVKFGIKVVGFIAAGAVVLLVIILVISVFITMYCLRKRYKLPAVNNHIYEDVDSKTNCSLEEKSTQLKELGSLQG